MTGRNRLFCKTLRNTQVHTSDTRVGDLQVGLEFEAWTGLLEFGIGNLEDAFIPSGTPLIG